MSNMNLMNDIHELRKVALSNANYEAVFAYNIAEDLTDALLKGRPADGPRKLRSAFLQNKSIAESSIELLAWAQVLELFEKHYPEV